MGAVAGLGQKQPKAAEKATSTCPLWAARHCNDGLNHRHRRAWSIQGPRARCDG